MNFKTQFRIYFKEGSIAEKSPSYAASLLACGHIMLTYHTYCNFSLFQHTLFQQQQQPFNMLFNFNINSPII